MKIVQDRTTTTISSVFDEYIAEGTLVKTDGWAAYPTAIRRCNEIFGMNLRHELVNHSIGFVNDDGTHTNTVENLWAHVRCAWRNRHGVNRTRINEFINEFKSRRLS